MGRILRAIRATPHQKFVVQLVQEWAEKFLTEWDASPDKRDWRNDKPPRCPLQEVLERARAVKDPEGTDSLPFLGDADHEESFLGMSLGALEED